MHMEEEKNSRRFGYVKRITSLESVLTETILPAVFSAVAFGHGPVAVRPIVVILCLKQLILCDNTISKLGCQSGGSMTIVAILYTICIAEYYFTPAVTMLIHSCGIA